MSAPVLRHHAVSVGCWEKIKSIPDIYVHIIILNMIFVIDQLCYEANAGHFKHLH